MVYYMFKRTPARPYDERRSHRLDELINEYSRARTVFCGLKVASVAVSTVAAYEVYESDSSLSLGMGGAAIALVLATTLRQESRTDKLEQQVQHEQKAQAPWYAIVSSPEMQELASALQTLPEGEE